MDIGAEVMICAGIGSTAISAMNEAGIMVYPVQAARQTMRQLHILPENTLKVLHNLNRRKIKE